MTCQATATAASDACEEAAGRATREATRGASWCAQREHQRPLIRLANNQCA